ncbi:PSD1 domain-containing protein [Arenibacter sp. BSSL-BM3]|uniref:PSD1 domain-containing protein n=2 Tax=Arenibacter arenosicollis TaxID=2762274 RepID=A0ABR7QT43_9FLAO|nr:PSD1 and planctomycete cytochrome C domain-containing protein [Arenibacter arenosicollis]MBC8770368.1 PSD1 domain-containing protein [Arenibacter arenosicollis]
MLQPSDTVDFSADIKPILNKNCITCHGGVKKSGGFSLLFEEEAFANTESGVPAIIPGNAAKSPFIQRLKEDDPELRMPYKKSKLSKEEIELLTKWVDQGAKWGKHWAYTLPEKVEIPEATQSAGISSGDSEGFIQNDIDHFILRTLKNNDLEPSLPAEPNVIARRLAMDITGLPPNDSLFSDFTAGKITYENMVDELLSQDAYGEKWASWWLDQARYADTKGYESDMGRTMWQYRDWVIKAFNKDMPYDQFTIEQLAGDLLPNPSADHLIATAFHRNTMNNGEGGTDDEEFRVAAVVDRVNTTFEVWQSTTIGCVQCHSHTYDPFKNREYYNLMAFFNNSRDEDTSEDEPNLKFYNEEQQKEVTKIYEWIAKNESQEVAEKYKNFLTYTEPIYHSHLIKKFENGNVEGRLSLRDNGFCFLNNVYTQGAGYMYLKYSSGIDGTTMTIKKDDADGEILSQFVINKTSSTIVRKIPFKKINEKLNLYIEADNNNISPKSALGYFTWFAFLPDIPEHPSAEYMGIKDSILQLLNTNTPSLPIMVENPDYRNRTTQVFERGNWLMKTDTVEPATPKSLNAWNDAWPKNRLGLSKWMVSKENPLTARTLVNRVWQQIYGRGIVASLEDMGSQSDPPSHPELLDWLALRFMNEHNWSIKALVKDIVMSGTYRQSSKNNAKLYNLDPENRLYARGPRIRLGAEQIRDQALAVSGLLSTKMYGPSVMPPQPDGIWQTVYNGGNWVESQGEDKYRKAIYTYLKRTSPYPSFLTFDAGSREVSTVRRTVTNTPLQALVTLNDPVYLETAYHLAKFMGKSNNVDTSIREGYRKAVLEDISERKLAVLKELYNTSVADFEDKPKNIKEFIPFETDTNANLAALTVVANAIMNLDEFLTKS